VLERALAETRRGIALRAWAQEHGYGWRTVYRDLKALEASGVPIYQPEKGRYALERDWQLKINARLTSEEMLALYGLRQLAAPVHKTRLGRALDRAWAKLSADVRQTRLMPRAASAGELSIRAWTPIDYGRFHRVIETLEAAVAERRAVVCKYRSLAGAVTQRTIEPGQLHYDPSLEALYLVAWCRLRDALRVFAVHRFLAAQMTDERFAMRAETRSAAALKDAFRVWRDARVQTVRVRLSGIAAAEARERLAHASQKLIADHGDELEVSFEVAGLAEIERWVLGLGGDAMVLAPEELRLRVRAQVERAAAAYGAPRARRLLKR
jgi:predicted DNA-binding transcriptional regulator YafY